MAVVLKDEKALKQEEKLREDLVEARRRINKKFRDQIIAWWNRVKDTAYRLCPKDTGTLASTIRVVKRSEANVGFHAEKVAEALPVVNRVIVAGGMKINPKTGRICDYATYVHDGHRTPSGGFVPPRPFLTDAIARHLPELQKILDEIFKEVE